LPIEEIQKGDYVLSRDEETGRIEWREVLQTFVTPDQPVLRLTFAGDDGKSESLKVTGEHPFYVKNRGWVYAEKLLPGDEVFTSSGGWLRVSNGTWLPERHTVYNFEVDGFHTYFVGGAGVWVHNNPCARVRLHEGRQGKHIFGHNNFRVEKGRSVFTHRDPQGLLDRFVGRGQHINDKKERVDFGENIGWFIDRDTGIAYKTKKGTIHHNDKGEAHIVPARP
ncbi:MAG: hypothetical protein F6K17_41080, partial [Okeania sp. SIO3C4]|nr:hypothetical protein [Okeania sp. SIO3C4]